MLGSRVVVFACRPPVHPEVFHMLMSSPLFALAAAVFFAGCVFVAVSDLLWRHIPNRAVLGLIAGVPLMVADGRLPIAAIAVSLGLSAGFLLIGTILFARGWIGGGDIKLICALILWLPPAEAILFVCLALIWGGFLAVATLALKHASERGFVRIGVAQKRLLSAELCVPYAVSIAAAGIYMFVELWL